ncbi:MAG: hypothetical protein LBI53_08020 [Candidatus Peribacteria bacterium]|nr:hypothetical protein [Candidatus Peribacteria bacterium]
MDTTGHKLVDYVRRGTPLDERTKLFLAYHTLQQFDTFFAMFIGILRTETKKLFINRPEDELQINPIINNIAFYQANLLIPKLKEFESQLKHTLQENDFPILRKQITHFLNICDTVAKVQRKFWSQSDFYFLFSEETKFTNRDEFTDIFANNHIVFFSHHETSYPKLIEKEEKAEKALAHCTSLSSLETRLQELTSTSGVSIFIISTIKEESRAIFEYLQKLPFLADYDLLVENITGGAGKNIFKANKKVAKIIVGGYNFLMMCYAQRVKLDNTIIRNIKGTQSKLILDDILRYDPT